HQLKRLARATATIQRPFHLDSYDDTRLPDELTVPNPAGQVVEEVNKEHLRIAIGEALRKLSPRQAKILMLRFGLHDGTPHTLEEIGQRLGVTRERIRQLEDKALRRLRHPSLSAKLRLYHDQE